MVILIIIAIGILATIIIRQIIKQTTILILRTIDEYKNGKYDKKKEEYNKDEFKKDK